MEVVAANLENLDAEGRKGALESASGRLQMLHQVIL